MGKDKTETYLQGLCFCSFIALLLTIASVFFRSNKGIDSDIGFLGLMFAGIIAFYAYYILRNLLKRIKYLEQQLENKVESKE